MHVSPFEHIVNFLAPEHCILCGTEGMRLCESCFQTNFSPPLARCYICNKITQDNRICSTCRPSSHLRRVWWLGNYEKTLKDLIWEMKYQRKRSNARLLGGYLAQQLPYLPEGTMIVPVPTATRRVRRRGFDQAAVLAEGFARKRGTRPQELLSRTTQTELIGKTRAERTRQMQNALRVLRPLQVSGASILLLDDVLTTGATLEAAATLLREAGAKHVDAAVIARALPR